MIVFEIIGGLILFVVLSLLSFVILPGLFGCFGFILFLGVLLWLIVTFSASLGWFIVLAIFSYLLIALLRIYRYYQLPGYDKYLASNINTYVGGTTHCAYCNSEHLRHAGLFGLRSKLRYYKCMKCHKHLYRFKVI